MSQRLLPMVVFAFAVLVLVTSSASVAQAGSARIDGVVTSTDGATLGGARVVAGATAITTGPDGRFSVACGGRDIDVRIEHAGYEDATRIGATCGKPLVVQLHVATLTTIGRVDTGGPGNVPFNAGPGAVAVVDRTRIDDLDATQFNRLLDQTPGSVSAHTGTSNPAAPGAQTSPNLRGTLDYEKTTLIDGHPVANGSHGDYVTTFLTTYLIDDVEIAKGPGADAPLVVNGVGGSINFRTFDPSSTATHSFDAGSDGYGGTILHAAASSTIGRLGYYVGLVSYDTPGPLGGDPTTVVLPAGTQIAGLGPIKGTTSGTPPKGTPAGAFPVAGAAGNPSNAYTTLVACCESVGSAFQARGELVKARWRFSDVTSLTAAFLGTQATSDQDGATLQSLNATLAPSGTPVALNPTTHLPGNQSLVENEPMFEAELRTALSPRDTVIARWYALSLNRLTGNAVTSPATAFTGTEQLTGTATLQNGGNVVFTGQSATVTIPNVYSHSAEEDKLHGGSFALEHAAGPNVYSLDIDRWDASTDAYAITAAAGQAVVNATIPAGSEQTVTAFLARAQLALTARDNLTLATYVTDYDSRFARAKTASGIQFDNATVGHVDPRLGFTHRFGVDVVGRFAAGSSLTPPNIGLVSVLTTAPTFTPGATSLTGTRNTGDLLPETAFGYDVGTDIRLRRDSVISFDAYETTLRNQFATTIAQTGTFTPPGGGAPIPVFTTANENVGDARFAGVEIAFRSDPRTGIGYIAQGALVRSYAYGVSPSIYATATNAFGTNLAVVPGINYTSTGVGFNGYGNKGIPYADGYGEIHVRAAGGALGLLGATYYGSNNSWNQRAFAVGNASVRIPLGAPYAQTTLALSVDNLWNTYPGTHISTGTGVSVPLANGEVGLVNALPIGPRVIRLDLHLGSR